MSIYRSVGQLYLKEFLHHIILSEKYQQAGMADLLTFNCIVKRTPATDHFSLQWHRGGEKQKLLPLAHQSPPFLILMVGILIMQSYLIDLKI